MTEPLAPNPPETLQRKYFGRVEALKISRGLRHPEFVFSSFRLFLFLHQGTKQIVTLQGAGAPPREREHELHTFRLPTWSTMGFKRCILNEKGPERHQKKLALVLFSFRRLKGAFWTKRAQKDPNKKLALVLFSFRRLKGAFWTNWARKTPKKNWR